MSVSTKQLYPRNLSKAQAMDGAHAGTRHTGSWPAQGLSVVCDFEAPTLTRTAARFTAWCCSSPSLHGNE
ncbi:hypothetical protein ABBQ38_005364 [Trebouxia sp. C0009 RCD-2024]